MDRLLHWLLVGMRWPRLTLLAVVVVSLLAGVGAWRLTIDTGLESLIPAGSAERGELEAITRVFGSDHRTLIFIRDRELWSPQRLQSLSELQRTLEGLPGLSRVESLFTTRTVRSVDGMISAAPLLTRDTDDPFLAMRGLEAGLTDPMLAGSLLSRDGMTTVVTLVYESAAGESVGYPRVASILADFADRFDELFPLGPSRMDAEVRASLWENLLILSPLSALVLVLGLFLFLGSLRAALLPLFTAGLSLLWCFGLMGWLGIPVNLLTAMLPSLTLVIGSTQETHLLTAYLNRAHGTESLVDKEGRGDALRWTLRHLAVPSLLCLFTTLLGFGSNLLNDIVMIRDFALAATLAILCNGFITLLLMPLLLSRYGPMRRRFGTERLARHAERFSRVIEGILVHHSGKVMLLTVLGCVGFALLAADLHVTLDPISYFRPNHPLVRQVERVHEHLAGTRVFYIHLEADEAGAFKNPGHLKALADIQGEIGRARVFDASISLADVLAGVNRAFHHGDPVYQRPPENRGLTEQYLLLIGSAELAPLVSPDFRQALIVVRHAIGDSHALMGHVDRLRGVATGLVPAGTRVILAGESLLIHQASERLLTGQVNSLGLLLGVIFVIMSLLFTSVRGGMVAILPNVVPIVFLFGLMGLLGIPINPGTAMVAVIAIGLAVDDTIHLMSHYNETCRRMPDRDLAVALTLRQEILPVTTTSFSLAVGFGVLTFSDFSIIAQFGALAAVCMLTALLADLLLTPMLLRRVRLVGLAQILALKVHRNVVEKSPLFHDMNLHQVKKAILLARLKEFEPGEVIVRQGDLGRSMKMILSGTVEVVRRRVNGEEVRLAVLEPGDVFGEIGYVRATRRSADVRALSPVEVLVFEHRQMESGLRFHPALSAKLHQNISRILGARLGEMVKKEV